MSDVNQAARAQRAWQVLTGAAGARNTITYKQLGDAIGIHYRVVRYVLGMIQDYCLEAGLPPLTILVISGSAQLPGSGFIAHDLASFDEGVAQVCNYRWDREDNPFAFAATGSTYEALVEELVHVPEDSGEVYARVKSRGLRHLLFRDAVRRAYRWRCAFTGVEFPEALEACHIVPWSLASPAERMDVRNGLLLNSFHHKLFDAGYMTLSPDYTMIYQDHSEKEWEHSPIERSLTLELHGRPLLLPRRIVHRPLTDYIQRHNDALDWMKRA